MDNTALRIEDVPLENGELYQPRILSQICCDSVGHVYMFGGMISSVYSADFLRFDPYSHRVTNIISEGYPSARNAHAMVCLSDVIYVIGGVKDVEGCIMKYDIAQNKWSRGPSIGNPGYGNGACVWDGKIYMYGGNGNNKDSNHMRVYNPERDTIEVLAENPSKSRFYFGLAACNWKVYAIGGFPNIGGVEMFDIMENTWSTLDVTGDIPANQHGFGCAAVGSHVFISGTHGTFSLDTRVRSWTQLTKEKSSLWCCMAQGGEFMYILGGESVRGLRRYRHNGLMEWSPESHVRTSSFFRAQVMRLMLLQSCGAMHDIPIELLFEVFRILYIMERTLPNDPDYVPRRITAVTRTHSVGAPSKWNDDDSGSNLESKAGKKCVAF